MADAPNFPAPTLMLVTDRRLAGGEDALVRAVADAVEGGANVVQLREKDLPRAALLPLANRLREVTAGRALLLVNGPLDLALEAGADGAHLPEVAKMMERPSPEFIVGRSVHSPAAARSASDDGVDYLVAGPVYVTASHPEIEPAGLEIIRKFVSVSAVPVIGIGGITAKNAPDVMRAGASGVAVVSDILGAGSPREAAGRLREAVNGYWRPSSWSSRSADNMSTISLNGKPHVLDGQMSVTGLLASLNINPKQVAVALNGEVVRRDTWADAKVAGGDTVEIVRAVGGG